MKKKIGVPPYPGVGKAVKVRGWGVDPIFFSFKKTLIRHFEKYLHIMMLKPTERVGISIFLLYKQKTQWNFDIQKFYSEILNFRLFFAKKSLFSGLACFYDVITT